MYTGSVDSPVEFEWDEGNTDHIALHGITPVEAEQVYTNDPLFIGVEFRENEWRSTCLGETGNTRVLLVVTTPREGKVRVVTAWPANRRWRNIWQKTKNPLFT